MGTKIIVARLGAASMVAALMLLPAARGAAAQSPTGEIRGVVVDPAGAPMSNVGITITHTTTSLRRELTTDVSGRFVAPALPAGPYEVAASLDGFAMRRQEDIALHAGRTVTLRLDLDKARAPDTITIGTPPRVVDTARSSSGSVVESAELLMLPQLDRNPLDLARVVPGTTGVLMPVLDGLFNGTAAGDDTVGLEAVRELSVVTTAAPSEFSGPLAAAVTRSGSNRFSGSAFDFVRESRTQFGGVLGGPMVPGRHFFFGSYDGVRVDSAATGTLPRNALLARTDHLLSRDHRLTLRFDDDVRSRVMASSTNALGNALLNEVRVQGSEALGQIADTLTLVHGGHMVRSGFDVSTDRLSGSGVDRYAYFIQDQWWINGSTTIDGGVRYGREWVPFVGLLDADADWQPRLGAAWSGRDARLAVRGAYRGMGDGVHHATAGVEWEWLPRMSIGVSYLDYRAAGERAGGVAAEIYRRFAQGMHYRVAYTRGTSEPAHPVLGALLPRSRFSGTFIYNTNMLADGFDGIVKPLLEDWTVSGILAHQTAIGISLDPRAARDIALPGPVRVTLLWEAFNLLGHGTVLTPRTNQFAARLSF